MLSKARDARHMIETEAPYAAQTLDTKLDRKQRKIVEEIIKILYETLEEAAFEKARSAIFARFQVATRDR